MPPTVKLGKGKVAGKDWISGPQMSRQSSSIASRHAMLPISGT